MSERASLDQRIRDWGIRISVSGGTRERDAEGWEHDAYRVKLTHRGRSMTLPYRMGTGHHGNPPQLADVLDALASDSAAVANASSFEEWADELGYDPDSRSHERTYRTVVAQDRRLRALLGDERYDALLWDTERD